ncbi:hypothetical protein PRO82_000911 [Candidatus Protochlamydia amoebophila]|nr:hypothetical protein [Candidatus Protochlamydia amoebophila]
MADLKRIAYYQKNRVTYIFNSLKFISIFNFVYAETTITSF